MEIAASCENGTGVMLTLINQSGRTKTWLCDGFSITDGTTSFQYAAATDEYTGNAVTLNEICADLDCAVTLNSGSPFFNEYLTLEEFQELWPLLMLMIVTAFGIKMVRRVFLN